MPTDNHKPSPYVSRTGVAEILGVSRQRVSALELRPGFPKPAGTVDAAERPIWHRRAIERFAAKRKAAA